MKLLKNRTVLGIACIVLSLFICFGLTPMFNKAVANKTTIVRVTKNITAGDEITSNMVQTVEVGGYNLPKCYREICNDRHGKGRLYSTVKIIK